MMVFISLLPQGLIQAWASFTHDYVSARSAEMIHSPLMQTLVWVRVPGDMVFTVGAVAFALFVFQALRAPDQASSRGKVAPIGEDVAPAGAS